MNLEAILEMWKKDSVIDEVLLDQAALKIPQLHQKYLTLLSEYNLLYKKTRPHRRHHKHDTISIGACAIKG